MPKGGDAIDIGGLFPIQGAVEPVERPQKRPLIGGKAPLPALPPREKEVREIFIPEGLGEERPQCRLLAGTGVAELNSH